MDPNDDVIGECEMAYGPERVILCERAKAVALVGTLRRRKTFSAPPPLVVVISFNGTIQAKLSEVDLYGETAQADWLSAPGRQSVFPRLIAATDPRKAIVLTLRQPSGGAAPFASVDLASGRARLGNEGDVRDAIRHTDACDAADALRLASALRCAVSPDDLRRLYDDEASPIRTRALAAGLLAQAGDRRGAALLDDLVSEAVVAAAKDRSFDANLSASLRWAEAIGYDKVTDKWRGMLIAIEYFPDAVGSDAVRVLSHFASYQRVLRSRARSSVAAIGKDAIPELMRLLDNSRGDAIRGWALETISDIQRDTSNQAKGREKGDSGS